MLNEIWLIFKKWKTNRISEGSFSVKKMSKNLDKRAWKEVLFVWVVLPALELVLGFIATRDDNSLQWIMRIFSYYIYISTYMAYDLVAWILMRRALDLIYTLASHFKSFIIYESFIFCISLILFYFILLLYIWSNLFLSLFSVLLFLIYVS